MSVHRLYDDIAHVEASLGWALKVDAPDIAIAPPHDADTLSDLDPVAAVHLDQAGQLGLCHDAVPSARGLLQDRVWGYQLQFDTAE
jgi:hypothetical protein